jgi:hypothetical protein
MQRCHLLGRARTRATKRRRGCPDADDDGSGGGADAQLSLAHTGSCLSRTQLPPQTALGLLKPHNKKAVVFYFSLSNNKKKN